MFLYLFIIELFLFLRCHCNDSITFKEEAIQNHSSTVQNHSSTVQNASADLDNRIIRGRPAHKEDVSLYYFHVSLQNIKSNLLSNGTSVLSGTKFCEGAIIHPNWVLTSAQCVVSDPSKGENLWINSGVIDALNYASPPSQLRKVKKTFIHDGHNPNSNDYDLALLQLTEPLVFNEYVDSAQLPRASTTIPKNATVSGWGKVFDLPDSHHDLQLAVVPIYDEAECHKFWPESSTNQLCVGTNHQRDAATCDGDTGSPLVTYCECSENHATIIGIRSFGAIDCGAYPSIYQKVTPFLSWIKGHMIANYNS